MANQYKIHFFLILFTVISLKANLLAETTLCNINTEVKGFGLHSKTAILNFLNLHEGQEFDNEEMLQNTVSLKISRLESTGYYREIEYDISPCSEDSYNLDLSMVAAWTIYPLPVPVYSSDSGLGLRTRLIWDNFLGQFIRAQLRFDINAEPESSKDNWTTGVSFSGIQLSQTLSLSLSSSLGNVLYDNDIEGFRASLGSALNVELEPFDENIKWDYNFGLRPQIEVGYRNFITGENSNLINDDQEYIYDNGSVNFTHYLKIDSTKYLDGLYKGYTAQLLNSIEVGTHDEKKSTGKLGIEDVDMTFSFIALQPYFDMLNFRGRFLVHGAYNIRNRKGVAESGDFLRGISEDFSRQGTLGIALNTEAMLRVWRDSTLGEIFLTPFFDLGMFGGVSKFGNIKEILQLAAGLDISWRINSLVMRFSLGKNLIDTQDLKITLGTGFYF